MKNKQGFFLSKLLLCLLLIVTSFNYGIKAEEPDNENDSGEINNYKGGYILAQQDIEAPVYDSEISLYANYPDSYPENVNYLREKYPASRNQGIYGTCWTFASNGLAEFSLINKGLATKDSIDLSELQLAYNTYYSVVDPLGGTSGDTSIYYNDVASNNYLNNGGNFIYSMKRFSQWASAVNESDVPYANAADTLTNGLDSKYAYSYDVAHLENAYIVDIKDTNTVKALIQEFGGVGAMYVHDNTYYAYFNEVGLYSYYNNALSGTNHAIMIVGWDDNFSNEYFSPNKPTNNGAWLVRNSWGTQSGPRYIDYFWLSYEDVTLGASVYAFDFNTADNYDNNYQLDGGINTNIVSSTYTGSYSAANVFTVDSKDGVASEKLKAVQLSFTRYGGVNYKLQVYTNLSDTTKPTSGNLALTLEDTTTYAGLITVELDESQYIDLSPGSSYSVIITVDDVKKLDFEGAISYVKDLTNNTYTWTQTVSTDNRTFGSYDGENFSQLNLGNSIGNLCLKAFTDNLYTLTFDANGGEVTPISKTLEYGDTYGELPEPTRTGYKFDGWYTSAEGGDKVSSTNTISGSTTIYAHWTQIEMVTITFDPNGGKLDEGTSNTSSYEKGEKYNTLPNTSRDGYSFVGWFTDKENGTQVTVDSKATSTTTLYAHWTANEYEYNVDYKSTGDKQLGTDKVKHEFGTTNEVKPNDFTGYTTPASQSVVWDSVDAKTITFEYTPIEYTITYNLDGGTNATNNPSRYTIEDSFTLNDASKEGYTFDGWYLDNTFNNKVTSVAEGSTGNKTLYAKWIAKEYPYTVTYVSKNTSNKLADDTTISKAFGTTNEVSPKDITGYTTPNKQSIVWDSVDAKTITFEYTPIEYTITYNLNGGTNNSSNPNSYTIESDSITLANPTKENYTFDAWYKDSSFTNKADTAITKGSTGNVVLYAKWLKIPHIVTFDSNGGSSVGTKTVEEGDTYGTLPTTTKTGYTFAGWYTSKDGGDKITSDSIVGNSDITLYAHWTANEYTYDVVYKSNSGKQLGTSTVKNAFGGTYDVTPKDFTGYTTPDKQSIVWDSVDAKTITFVYTPIEYTITYNLNGGTNSDKNPTSYNIESDLISLSIPTKTGNKFEGWYLDESFSTKANTINSGSYGNKTFYAKWSLESYKYTINYVSSTGLSLGTSSLTKEYGTSETISAPSKNGYNTPASQTVIWDKADKTITFTYEPIKYTITYNNLNGADNSVNTSSYTIEDSNITLKDIALEGYTFNGWFTDEKLTNKTSTIDTSLLKDYDVYASWNINQYTLTYDVGDGYLDKDQTTSITLDYGSKYGTLPNVTAKKGYKFVGWFSKKDGGNIVTADTTIGASNITIYAHYEEIVYKPYTLTFNGNGGTPSETNRTVKETSAIGDLPSASRNGYTFIGWFTSIEGGSEVSSTYEMPSNDLTIYAHWSVNSYKLTFVSDGVTLLEKDVNYEATLGDLPTPNDKLGYEFIGWFDSNDTEYANTSTMPASSLILTAKWKALDKPTIIFNGNGGTVSEDGGQVNFDGTLVGSLPIATRKGYTFVGWYSQTEGGDKLEDNSNFTGISEIYAHWNINSYIISFDSDKGSDEASISVEYGSTYFDKLPIPTKEKYKFLGWYTSEGNKVDETYTMADKDITLYAHWEYVPQAYTLTLDHNDGTSIKDTKSVMENEKYGDLPTLTRDGYVFDGWYDSKENGTKVTANTIMDTNDVTIYAHWIRINRTIKLNANLNGVDDSSIYVDDNNKFIGSLPKLDKYGKYNFDGWYTSALNGTKVDDNTTLTGIDELYAHWTKDPGEIEVIEPETDDSTKSLKPKLDAEDSTVKNLLTDEENNLVLKGDDADIYLSVVEDKDEQAIDLGKSELNDKIFGIALDITLNIKVGDNTPRVVHDSKDEVSITIDIPTSLINKDSSKTRTYYIIRVHKENGKYEVTYINPTYDKANNTLTFKSSKFSTYIIAYKDTNNPIESSGDNNQGHAVTCEEYNHSKNWTWSETQGKCVYRVKNTGSK